MTYNEWRDELKSNLLCVTESERRRVLDYYAEAYADRRDAGFSEREIIDDFGAPYDAAQRILNEKDDYFEPASEQPREATRREIRQENRERRREEQREAERERRERRHEEHARRAEQERYERRYERERYDNPPPPPAPDSAPAATAKSNGNYTWVFVILCIIFAAPLFGLIMGMVGITIGFVTAPIALIGCGAAYAGMAVGTIFSGQVASGFCDLGISLVLFGVGVALCPVFIKLVKLMWSLFKKVFAAIKNAFAGKEIF